MADWQDCNPSNEPNTCLWCGRKLRFESKAFTEGPKGEYIPNRKDRPKFAKSGAYQDGFFCGLRCAYQFAVAFAGFGKRLQPK